MVVAQKLDQIKSSPVYYGKWHKCTKDTESNGVDSCAYLCICICICGTKVGNKFDSLENKSTAAINCLFKRPYTFDVQVSIHFLQIFGVQVSIHFLAQIFKNARCW